MNFSSLRFWIVLTGFVLVIGVASAAAQVKAVNPLHCDFWPPMPDNLDSAAVLWYNPSGGEVEYSVINMSVFPSNNPYTVPIPPTVSDLTWNAVACGDFNGDGFADVAWVQNGTNAVSLWLTQPNCPPYAPPCNVVLTQSCTFAPSSPWQVEAAADMNGDGKLDLLWRNPSTGQHVIWYLDGCTVLSMVPFVTVSDPNWRVKATGDFNGDGNADLLWLNTNTGVMAIWLMNNTTVLSSAVFGPYPGWRVAQVADFNADGKSDILWQNDSTGQVSIWYMDGLWPTSFYNFTVPIGWEAVGADDYDINGTGTQAADILWVNYTLDEWAVWLLNAPTQGTTTEWGPWTFGSGWQVVSGTMWP